MEGLTPQTSGFMVIRWKVIMNPPPKAFENTISQLARAPIPMNKGQGDILKKYPLFFSYRNENPPRMNNEHRWKLHRNAFWNIHFILNSKRVAVLLRRNRL
jgi:hypothetical protein